MSETDQVFQSSIEILLTDPYGTIDAQNARRLSELCVGTLYNQLCHRNKRRKKNQDGLEAGHPQDLWHDFQYLLNFWNNDSKQSNFLCGTLQHCSVLLLLIRGWRLQFLANWDRIWRTRIGVESIIDDKILDHYLPESWNKILAQDRRLKNWRLSAVYICSISQLSLFLCVKQPYFTSGAIYARRVVHRPFYVFLLDTCEFGVSRSSLKIGSTFHKWPGYIYMDIIN